MPLKYQPVRLLTYNQLTKMNSVYLKGSCHVSDIKSVCCSKKVQIDCMFYVGSLEVQAFFFLQDKTSLKHLQIKLLSTMKLFDTEDRLIKLWKMSFMICLDR